MNLPGRRSKQILFPHTVRRMVTQKYLQEAQLEIFRRYVALYGSPSQNLQLDATSMPKNMAWSSQDAPGTWCGTAFYVQTRQKIELNGNKNSWWVWCEMKDGSTEKNLIQTGKYGAGSVVWIWGCFFSKCPGNLICSTLHSALESMKSVSAKKFYLGSSGKIRKKIC